jgi:hypothetical protein
MSIKRNIFRHRDPFSNFAWSWTYTTTEEDEYFYSYVNMGIAFGMVLEQYYLRIHKKTFVIEDWQIWEPNPLPPRPARSRSITADGKYWYYTNEGIYLANTIDGDGEEIIDLGYSIDEHFPVPQFEYGYLMEGS